MNKDELAQKLHEWYLEATEKLDPGSFNANANKNYKELTEQQRSIDKYIAGKILEALK